MTAAKARVIDFESPPPGTRAVVIGRGRYIVPAAVARELEKQRQLAKWWEHDARYYAAKLTVWMDHRKTKGKP